MKRRPFLEIVKLLKIKGRDVAKYRLLSPSLSLITSMPGRPGICQKDISFTNFPNELNKYQEQGNYLVNFQEFCTLF